MKHEFYCRARRYYRDDSYEVWSIELDYGEGYMAEDKMILEWNHNEPKVLCFIKSDDRMESEEYISFILGLFEDLTDGEGSFEIKRIHDVEVEEYDVNDLIEKIKLFYHNDASK